MWQYLSLITLNTANYDGVLPCFKIKHSFPDWQSRSICHFVNKKNSKAWTYMFLREHYICSQAGLDFFCGMAILKVIQGAYERICRVLKTQSPAHSCLVWKRRKVKNAPWPKKWKWRYDKMPEKCRKNVQPPQDVRLILSRRRLLIYVFKLNFILISWKSILWDLFDAFSNYFGASSN